MTSGKMVAKTRFQQSEYYLRNLRMNDVKPWPGRIAVTSYKQHVQTGDDFMQIRLFVAVRGGIVGSGPTPARARYRLREKEGIGR